MNADHARQIVLDCLALVAASADLAALSDDADLGRELGLDSMDFLNMVTALQERAGLEVPERDYPLLATVRSATAYVAERAR